MVGAAQGVLDVAENRIHPSKLGALDSGFSATHHHRLMNAAGTTFLREYEKVARRSAHEGLDHVEFLSRLVELELIDRERRLVERRIRAAKFPTVKSLDSFEFKAIPSLSKIQVLELARCEWIERRENVIALGPSGTGKTHVAQGLGLAACQRGLSVRFVTAAALVHELMEARDERRLLRLQKQMANHKLLIIDELGFVPLSKTGAELLFELVSQRYERAAVLITSNLPFDEWTETFGTERLTGALLDRLPSRSYPGIERPELPPQPQPRAKQGLYDLICASPLAGNCARATPSLRFRLTPPPVSSRPPRTISPRRPRWQCFAPPFGLVSLRP